MPSSITDPFFFGATLLINRIVIGCTQLVDEYGPENQWESKVRKSLKEPRKFLVAMFVIQQSKQGERREFSPFEIEDRFLKSVGKVHHSTVTQALKGLVRLNYLKNNGVVSRRLPGRHKAASDSASRPGPRSQYSRSDYEIFLNEFVRSTFPRRAIYLGLRESGILHRFLKFYHYERMITVKYSKIEDLLKGEKAKSTNTIEFFSMYYEQLGRLQMYLKERKDDRIMLYATRLVNRDLDIRDWENDQLYSTFFKCGGLIAVP